MRKLPDSLLRKLQLTMYSLSWVLLLVLFFAMTGCASSGKQFVARCMGPRAEPIVLDYRQEVRVGCHSDLDNYTCIDGPVIAENFAGIWFVRCRWGFVI